MPGSDCWRPTSSSPGRSTPSSSRATASASRGLELLARLAAAPDRCLRLSALAAQAGLSLSRVSRIAVTLETRGLIERTPCDEDARAVEAHLTPAGLTLMREAQATHFASVQQRFFDELRPGELEALAAVFGRFSPRAAAT